MTIREEARAGRPLSCPVIDAHTHLRPYHMSGWHQKYDGTETQSVLARYARLGVNCIVTAPHPLVQGRMEDANRIAAEEAARFPGKVYGYISIVPACGMDAVREAVRRYGSDPRFVGFKFLSGYHGEILQPEYEYAMDFADEAGCPVLCHEWNDVPKRSGFEAALRTRHRMKLIIAHQGGGAEPDTRICAPLVREHGNAYMELCGSLYNRLTVDEIAELVGAEKLIFGTDAINLDPKYELGKVAFSPMPDEAKKRIFAGNFLRLLEDSQMGHIALSEKE